MIFLRLPRFLNQLPESLGEALFFKNPPLYISCPLFNLSLSFYETEIKLFKINFFIKNDIIIDILFLNFKGEFLD